MNYNKNPKYDFIFSWLGVFTIILIWFLTSFIVDNNYVIPKISDTLLALYNILGNSSTYTAFLLTFLRTIASIAISILLGIIVGFFAGFSKKIRLFFSPFVSLFRFVPIPCYIYMLRSNLLNNLDFLSIIISFFVVFPLIYESIVGALVNLDEYIKLSLRLEGIYSRASIFKVLLPSTFPYLNVGIINAIGNGVKISIMSEILIGSNKIRGIGRLIYSANIDADFPKLLAITVLVIILFIFIDLILILVKKRIKTP